MKTPFDFGRRLDGCNPEANLSLYGRLAAEVAMTRMLRQPALCLRRDHGKLAPDAAQDLNALRSFRNTVVHEPKKIKAGDLQGYLDLGFPEPGNVIRCSEFGRNGRNNQLKFCVR